MANGWFTDDLQMIYGCLTDGLQTTCRWEWGREMEELEIKGTRRECDRFKDHCYAIRLTYTASSRSQRCHKKECRKTRWDDSPLDLSNERWKLNRMWGRSALETRVVNRKSYERRKLCEKINPGVGKKERWWCKWKCEGAKIRNNLKRRGKDIPTPAYKNYCWIFRDGGDR